MDSQMNLAMMHIYDPDLPVVLKTDASRHAVGAVLRAGRVPGSLAA